MFTGQAGGGQFAIPAPGAHAYHEQQEAHAEGALRCVQHAVLAELSAPCAGQHQAGQDRRRPHQPRRMVDGADDRQRKVDVRCLRARCQRRRTIGKGEAQHGVAQLTRRGAGCAWLAAPEQQYRRIEPGERADMGRVAQQPCQRRVRGCAAQLGRRPHPARQGRCTRAAGLQHAQWAIDGAIESERHADAAGQRVLFDKSSGPQHANALAVGKQQHGIVGRRGGAQCAGGFEQGAGGGRAGQGITRRRAAVVVRCQQQGGAPRSIGRGARNRGDDVVHHSDRVVDAAEEPGDRCAYGGALHGRRQSHRAQLRHQIGARMRIVVAPDRTGAGCQHPLMVVGARGPRRGRDRCDGRRHIGRGQRLPGQGGEGGQCDSAGKGMSETRDVESWCYGADGIHRLFSMHLS